MSLGGLSPTPLIPLDPNNVIVPFPSHPQTLFFLGYSPCLFLTYSSHPPHCFFWWVRSLLVEFSNAFLTPSNALVGLTVPCICLSVPPTAPQTGSLPHSLCAAPRGLQLTP